jgi:hypothetical protein
MSLQYQHRMAAALKNKSISSSRAKQFLTFFEQYAMKIVDGKVDRVVQKIEILNVCVPPLGVTVI